MSQIFFRVHWLGICEFCPDMAALEPEWDILMTNPDTPIVIRVMRPLLAGVITIFIVNSLTAAHVTPEQPVSAELIIHVPTAS